MYGTGDLAGVEVDRLVENYCRLKHISHSGDVGGVEIHRLVEFMGAVKHASHVSDARSVPAREVWISGAPLKKI